MLHSQTTAAHPCRVGISLCYLRRARMSDRQAAMGLQIRPPHLRCRWINHCAVLRREQVIIVGILTSVCQSEGQLCLRGRSMLICSAGKKKLPLTAQIGASTIMQPQLQRFHFRAGALLRVCVCLCLQVHQRLAGLPTEERETTDRQNQADRQTNGARQRRSQLYLGWRSYDFRTKQ